MAEPVGPEAVDKITRQKLADHIKNGDNVDLLSDLHDPQNAELFTRSDRYVTKRGGLASFDTFGEKFEGGKYKAHFEEIDQLSKDLEQLRGLKERFAEFGPTSGIEKEITALEKSIARKAKTALKGIEEVEKVNAKTVTELSRDSQDISKELNKARKDAMDALKKKPGLTPDEYETGSKAITERFDNVIESLSKAKEGRVDAATELTEALRGIETKLEEATGKTVAELKVGTWASKVGVAKAGEKEAATVAKEAEGGLKLLMKNPAVKYGGLAVGAVLLAKMAGLFDSKKEPQRA